MKYQNERGGRIVLQDIKVRVKKKSKMIFVILRKPKSMINRSKRKLNLPQSGILERARAFQVGVILHERRSAFSYCYCTNTYANDFVVHSFCGFSVCFPAILRRSLVWKQRVGPKDFWVGLLLLLS